MGKSGGVCRRDMAASVVKQKSPMNAVCSCSLWDQWVCAMLGRHVSVLAGASAIGFMGGCGLHGMVWGALVSTQVAWDTRAETDLHILVLIG